MFKRFSQFLKDVRAEFKRVSWPTRDATVKSTTVVVVLSLAIAVFLGIADIGISEVMKSILTPDSSSIVQFIKGL